MKLKVRSVYVLVCLVRYFQLGVLVITKVKFAELIN